MDEPFPILDVGPLISVNRLGGIIDLHPAKFCCRSAISQALNTRTTTTANVILALKELTGYEVNRMKM